MAAFFTADELQARVGQSIESTKAQMLADAASDIVRDDLRQQIDEIQDDEVVLYGDGSELLVLPERPVTAVSEVLLAGQALTQSTSWRRNGSLWRLTHPGSQYAGVRQMRWPNGVAVAVTYTHGYATVPGTIKDVALELAAATYSKDDSMSNGSANQDASYRWQQMVLMQSALQNSNLRSALDRYRTLDA